MDAYYSTFQHSLDNCNVICKISSLFWKPSIYHAFQRYFWRILLQSTILVTGDMIFAIPRCFISYPFLPFSLWIPFSGEISSLWVLVEGGIHLQLGTHKMSDPQFSRSFIMSTLTHGQGPMAQIYFFHTVPESTGSKKQITWGLLTSQRYSSLLLCVCLSVCVGNVWQKNPLWSVEWFGALFWARFLRPAGIFMSHVMFLW